MAFNWDKITQDSKQFIKTPLAIIMLLVLMALAWSTRLSTCGRWMAAQFAAARVMSAGLSVGVSVTAVGLTGI